MIFSRSVSQGLCSCGQQGPWGIICSILSHLAPRQNVFLDASHLCHGPCAFVSLSSWASRQARWARHTVPCECQPRADSPNCCCWCGSHASPHHSPPPSSWLSDCPDGSTPIPDCFIPTVNLLPYWLAITVSIALLEMTLEHFSSTPLQPAFHQATVQPCQHQV